jgi:hypothetical protein
MEKALAGHDRRAYDPEDDPMCQGEIKIIRWQRGMSRDFIVESAYFTPEAT